MLQGTTVILLKLPPPLAFTNCLILAVVKGLGISKQIKIFGYKNTDLRAFDKQNVEKLLSKNLIEKKLIKPLYLS